MITCFFISNRTFIRVHNSSENRQQIVESFSKLKGMPIDQALSYVAARAWSLRNRGYELKLFPRIRKPIIDFQNGKE
ncbi:MAG: hypothetical protein AABY22_07755 [Nanoarchaeota archaeon]